MNPEFLEEMGFKADRGLLEAQVLGCLLRKPGWLKTCDLQVTDFSGVNREIFHTIITLVEDGYEPDLNSVWIELKGRTGIQETISKAANTIPTTHHFPDYQRRLKAEIIKEKQRSEADIMASRIKAGADPVEASDTMKKNIKGEETRLNVEEKEEESFTQTVKEVCRQIAAEETIIAQMSGISWLDRTLKGFMPGDLTYMAARPSQGKTALTMQILIEGSIRGIRSVFFSKEMTQEKLAIRLLQYLSFSNAGALLRGTKDKEIKENVLAIRQKAEMIAANIKVISQKITGTSFVLRELEKAITQGCTLMALDYIQLMVGKGRTRNEEIGSISTELKNIIKDSRVPGIVLSQMNRGVEQDKRLPRLSDLKDSGNLEQDADNVCFLHRDKDGIGEYTMFMIAKGRDIGTGFCKLRFDGISQRFSEITN